MGKPEKDRRIRRLNEMPELVHRGGKGYRQSRRVEEKEPNPMIEPGDDQKTRDAKKRLGQ